jgi:hypothetical protein
MATWSTTSFDKQSWNPSGDVATDPNPGRTQNGTNPSSNVDGAVGAQTFPAGQKTQMEFKLGTPPGSYAFLQSALEIGICQAGNVANNMLMSYNLGISKNDEGGGSATILADPQGDVSPPAGKFTSSPYNLPINAAPSVWHAGGIVTMLVDRVNNLISWLYHDSDGDVTIIENGSPVTTSGYNTGTFSISQFAGETVTFRTLGWWLGGFTVTCLGGGSGQTLTYPQSGYTNLDGGVVVSNPMTAINITSISPNPVVAAATVTIVATAVGGPFASTSDVLVSSDTTTEAISYFSPLTNGGTVVLSNSNLTATITYTAGTSITPHAIYVSSASSSIASAGSTVNFVSAPATTTTVAITDKSFRFSPYNWYGNTSGRSKTTSAGTSWCGAFWDFSFTGSSAATLFYNVSATGGTPLFDALVNGVIVSQGIGLTGGTVLKITTGLVNSGANWVRIYLSEDGGVLTEITLTSAVIDSGSTSGTAPATPSKWMLMVGDGLMQPVGTYTTNAYPYLMAKALGLSTWDVAVQASSGDGWTTTTGETGLPYYAATGNSLWDLVDPNGTSGLVSGLISSQGSANTPPNVVWICLGEADCSASVATATLQARMAAAFAAVRTATSSATLIVLEVPFGLEDSTAFATGATYVTCLLAAVAQANTAGSNIMTVDHGTTFAQAMRTNGQLQSGNIYPTPAGHQTLATANSAALTSLLNPVVIAPTVTVNVPSPLVAGSQLISGSYTGSIANIWLAWSTSQYNLTTSPLVVLATISGGTFSATMNITAPTQGASSSGGGSGAPTGSGTAIVSTMYYSTNANLAATTVNNSAAAVITFPTVPNQLQGQECAVQVTFNYLPTTPNTVTPTQPLSNLLIGVGTTGATPGPIANYYVLPTGAAITVPASIANQQTGTFFSIQVGFNYIPNRNNLYYTPVDTATTAVVNGTTVCPFSSGLSNGGTITWDSTGQLATFKFFFNTATTWNFQIFDSSDTGTRSASVSFVTQTGAVTGGGGTATVATPTTLLVLATGSSSPTWDSTGQILTVPLSNNVVGNNVLLIEDTTVSASAPISASTTIVVNTSSIVGGGLVAAAAAPSGPIQLQPQTNGTWSTAPGNWALSAGKTLTAYWSDGTISSTTRPNGVTIVKQTLLNYAFTLFSINQQIANQPIVLNFIWVGGIPLSIDVTFNNGALWTTIPSANLGLNQATYTGSLTYTAGLPAGTIAAGYCQIRDTQIPSVVGKCGAFTVSAFAPNSVSGAGLLFYFDPGNPACITTDGNGNVIQINDAYGSGRFMVLGPLDTPPNLATVPPALVQAAQAFNLTKAAVGPAAPLLRTSGSDGARTLVKMTPTSILDNQWDANANFFTAGTLGGSPNNVNDPLINLPNSATMTTGSYVIAQAFYVDVTVDGGVNAGYGAGLLWGDWLTSSTVQYMTAGRWHAGQFAAQLDDATSGEFVSPSVGLTSSQWASSTLVKNGTAFAWQLNNGAMQTGTIADASPFTATTCGWGASITNYLNQPGGNAFPIMGAFAIYSGTMGTPDQASLGLMVRQSVGLFT